MKIGYFIEGAYDKLFDSMESNRDKYKMKTPWIKDYFRDTDFFVEEIALPKRTINKKWKKIKNVMNF